MFQVFRAQTTINPVIQYTNVRTAIEILFFFCLHKIFNMIDCPDIVQNLYYKCIL